jgi:Tol biopolymer transport system component
MEAAVLRCISSQGEKPMTRLKITLVLTSFALIAFPGRPPIAAPKFSEWSAPVIVPNVNSEFSEVGPGISRDGRSLYFGSDRPGGFGNVDLWVSQRARVTDPWGPPVNLGATINTAAAELVPAFSRDGHWMFFSSDRPGGHGGLDVWASFRRNVHDDFAWRTPVNLGANVNTSGLDAGASYFQTDNQDDDGQAEDNEEKDGLAMIFFNSDRPGGMGLVDLYVTTKNSNGTFGPPTLLSELNSPFNDQRPTIRSDGLEIFFFSNRPGGMGGADLWVATRETLDQVWSTPENLGPIVNGPSNDFHPFIASNGQTLYFASARPGGPGLNDLYMTTRTKHKASKKDENKAR